MTRGDAGGVRSSAQMDQTIAIFCDFSGTWTHLEALIFLAQWTADMQEPRLTHDGSPIATRLRFDRGAVVAPLRRNRSHDRRNIVGIPSNGIGRQ